MNRKTAIKLLTSAACGLLNQRVTEAQQKPKQAPYKQRITSEGYATAGPPPKSTLTLDLEYFDGFVIRNGSEMITITPEEIWLALKDEK